MAYYDEEESLESKARRKPDLGQIRKELHQANIDSSVYTDRMASCRGWWLCEWPGQSTDGRRWALSASDAGSIFPWNGCSDSRLRTVSTLINEHVMLACAAFWSAKVQAQSIRPIISARESALTTLMLKWTVYTKMRRELISELPLAFSWKYGGGLMFLGIEWEQQREIAHVPISIDMLSQLTASMGTADITDKILDPDKAYDEDLVKIIQGFSPTMPTADARRVLNDLRNTGEADMPIASLRLNKPKWTALRPLIDVWFPSETSDIQQARWTARRELVSEAELTDRIATDGYSPDFVEEALEHKGVFSGFAPYQVNQLTAMGSDRDLVELFHFRARYLDNGIPCMYKTIFCMALGDEGPYAVHRKDEYEHQQYPLVALRRSHVFRPLLSSIGIAEEAYTDELDIKRQQDGLNDRTDLIHQPPMIIPTTRSKAQSQAYGPRSVMTSLRPDAVTFPPLPPMDQTPVLVMQFVMQRLNRRYPTQVAEGVDPQLVSMYRTDLATDILSELELALEQTLQLGDQYWTDEEWMNVTGSENPNYTQGQTQHQYTISATVDINMIDMEAVKIKGELLAQLMAFKDAGGAVFNAFAQAVDPDLADMLAQDQMSPAALKKEKDDEYNAWGQLAGGIVAQKPMMANNQLRLQTIMQEIMTQPTVQQRMANDQNFAKLAEDRIKFFQAQIQQYEVNPTIGRTLTKQPNQPMALPNTTNAQAAQ